ncbi:MAG: flagellar biosynthetic protein FliQ [Planctomycetota bacterium]|jgi:flagellar biosynthetic protein FliQ
MTQEAVILMAEKMLWTAFIVSLPLLITALLVGVLISIFQTVTGVQEMTLTFVPKISAVLAILMLFMPWIISVLVAYTEEIFVYFAGAAV